jgi:Na+-transporting methylmalonyl-CoA/oxaloacetate decarboxylase gamma subunit
VTTENTSKDMKYLIRNKKAWAALTALLTSGILRAEEATAEVKKVSIDWHDPFSWVIVLLVMVMMLAILSFPAVIKILAYKVKENREKGLIILGLLAGGTASAAPEEGFLGPEFLQQLDGSALLVLLGVSVVVFTFISLFRIMWKMAQLAKTQEQVAVELEAKRTGNTAWGRLMKQLTDAKPVEAEGDILLDHDYDGIKELDNNLLSKPNKNKEEN